MVDRTGCENHQCARSSVPGTDELRIARMGRANLQAGRFDLLKGRSATEGEEGTSRYAEGRLGGVVVDQTMLWRRLDLPGHESSRLVSRDAHWHLTGTAVFAYDRQPCRLDYLVVCDPEWHTVSGTVTGWVGRQTVEVALTVDPDRRWYLNGTECPAVAGCIDVDLNFSPSTNLLPIRRLGLAVGQEAEVRAAWLRFPTFTLEPLGQVYHRTGAATYRYESAGGRFVAELEVNPAGFVTHYGNFWQAEASR